MRIVIFGLTLSSSWGNGHATLWRGLLKALARQGHSILFYEKDVSYYAENRDGWQPPARIELRLYNSLEEVTPKVRWELAQADLAIVTSYCPEGAAVSRLLLDSAATTKVFYDLDTPVTLDALNSGVRPTYLPAQGLGEFDVVLSYTGGRALDELEDKLGAKRVAPLYGWVDPDIHYPTSASDEFRCTLSYLGTYAADRQQALETLFIKVAMAHTESRFLIGGAQYPDNFPWVENIYFVRHMPPSSHPQFFCSSRATLNVTRGAMAAYGYCPSGRLFEAAACGTAIVTDVWEGLGDFFHLGSEVLPVTSTAEVLAAISLSDRELKMIAEAARVRTLEEHTADSRARELEGIVERVYANELQPASAA